MSEQPVEVPAAARAVLQAFVDAGLARNEAGMKACLTRHTLESGQFNPDSAPEGLRFEVGDGQMEGPMAVITMKAFPSDSPADAAPVMEMACLVVQEEGQWKFDLSGTMDRMMGGLQQAMEQMAVSMGDAMKGIGEAMAEGLQEAFNGLPAEPEPEKAPEPLPPPSPKPRRKRKA
ncbi:MAG: hypothetical protein NTV86_06455 [Planctomycetota bacterium]|nr:hypothetical protein [Planctomycetota bacterium]